MCFMPQPMNLGYERVFICESLGQLSDTENMATGATAGGDGDGDVLTEV